MTTFRGWDRFGFGAEVKRLRKERGLSCEAVSRALGSKSVTVGWRLEHGQREPFLDAEQLNRLAVELGVEPVQLLRVAGYGV